MEIRKVDIGARANDGAGDALRDAFEKINFSLDALAAAVAARLAQRTDFAPLHHEHDGYVSRLVRCGPPREPPPLYGALWIDTIADEIYIARGAGAVSDWRKLCFETPA